MNDIFSDYGKIITGERYIHREDIEKSLYNRVLGNNYGSYSLVGLHRVGKSSLVYNLFKNCQEICISLVLSNIDTIEEFFDTMISKIYKIIKKQHLINDNIEYEYNEYFNNKKYFKTNFIDFIEIVADSIDKRIVIIIDEFDYATKLFKDNANYFQIIRELAIQDIYKTSFVLISRRLIEDIEIKMGDVSNLKQVLKTDYLKPFNNEEVEKYFIILSSYLEINDEIKKFYKDKTGYLPYLMDVLSHRVISNNTNNYEEIYKEYKHEFIEQYEKFKSLLEEEELFDDLLLFVFDLPDYSKINIQKLKNYGILDENYEILSKELQEYLLNCRCVNDFYKLWNKSENYLKELIKSVFKKHYGNNWLDTINNKYENLISFQNAKRYKSTELKNNPNQPKDTIFIDTMATSGVLNLILDEFVFFQNILGENKNYWKVIFSEIVNIRNITHHNRMEILGKENDTKKITFYLEEINKKIETYLTK